MTEKRSRSELTIWFTQHDVEGRTVVKLYASPDGLSFATIYGEAADVFLREVRLGGRWRGGFYWRFGQ